MHNTQTHINRTPIFQEYSQKDIQREIMSNKILETTLSVLKGLNIKGYVYGQYVRNLFLNISSETINVWVFGDVIKVAKNIKAGSDVDCTINISKKTKNVILTFKYAKQINLVLTNTVYSYSKVHKAPKYFSSEYFLSYSELTIDSLAICLYGQSLGTLINPYNGLDHIRTGCITTISDPWKVFSNNPDLVIECFTLLSYPNFHLSERCKKALRNACSLYIFSESKRELVNEMMSKVIHSSKFSSILSEMHELGFLSKILPEVTALDTTEYKNGFTYRNDFSFTLKILNEVCQKTENITLRLITLFMYIGKFKAKKFNPIKGWTFHGTHFISAEMVPSILKRLGLKHELMRAAYYKDMIIMLKNLRSLDVVNDSDSAIRRIITNAGENLDDLLLLHNSYKKVQHQLKSTIPFTEDLLLKKRIQRVLEKDNKIQCKDILSINGHMILDMYPKCTGRQIGHLKQKMAQEVLDGKVSNDFKSLLPLLLSYAKELGLKEKSELEIAAQNLNQELKVQKFNNYRIVQSDTSLTIYENGTFVIEYYNDNGNVPNTMVIKDESQDMILQCYETGNVNKVNINEIFKLRREFVYNNAIYRKALLQNILVSSDKEFLMLNIQKKNKSMIQIVPVSTIKEHSMLGLKGTNIIQECNILHWNIVRNCDETTIFKVFDTNRFPISININKGVTEEIANWIKKYVF